MNTATARNADLTTRRNAAAADRAKYPLTKGYYKGTCHRDGTFTVWSARRQQWERTTDRPTAYAVENGHE